MIFLRSLFLLSVLSATTVEGRASNIDWNSDLEVSFKASAASGKPVMALQASQKQAEKFLTHPLLREAIESEFHPTLAADDSKEASVQFLDAQRNIIASETLTNTNTESLAAAMVETLQSTDRTIPLYLSALSGEASADSVGTVAFAMFCFWTGEQKLGGLNGVLTTEAGWFENREVTKVTFDRAVLPFETLLAHALSFDCAREVYTTNNDDASFANHSRLANSALTKSYRKAKSSDQKRQLSGTILQKLDLTPMQATKVNAFARTEPKEALKWLSPNQISKLK